MKFSSNCPGTVEMIGTRFAHNASAVNYVIFDHTSPRCLMRCSSELDAIENSRNKSGNQIFLQNFIGQQKITKMSIEIFKSIF